MAVKKIVISLILIFIFSILCTIPVAACTFVNVEAARANSLAVATAYWAASALVAGVVAYLQIRQKRLSLLVLGFVVLFLVFHPAWTVPQTYGSDCEFLNVLVSKLVIAMLFLLLGYEVVKSIRRARAKTKENVLPPA